MKKTIVFLLIAISFLSVSLISPYQSAFAVGEACNNAPAAGPIVNCTAPDVCTNKVCTSGQGANALRPVSQAEIYVGGIEGSPCSSFITGMIACTGISNMLGGKSGGTAQVITAIRTVYVNKPASTGTAIADLKSNLGLPVKTAYAQATGYGFVALNPILGLWKVMRNLALGGFVIIFVVIGIMIMLRKNIDPRTIVTIQQSLPRVIIALILVIFSYAICGLLIDVMTIATRGGLLVLQNAGLVAQGNQSGTVTNPLTGTVNFDAPTNADILLNMNIFGLFDQLYNVDLFLESVASLGNVQYGFDTIANVLNFGKGWVQEGILRTILWIAIFTAMLRVFFMLLTAYLSVVLNIIFSPLRFLMSAIPGSETTFESWLRTMFRHLLVFPTVFFLLCFAAIFNARQGSYLWKESPGETNIQGQHPNYWNVGGTTDAQNGLFTTNTAFWAPPALGNWYAAVGPLLSFAILLTIPKASNMITEALKLKPGSHEGFAGASLKEAANRVPIVGGLLK